MKKRRFLLIRRTADGTVRVTRYWRLRDAERNYYRALEVVFKGIYKLDRLHHCELPLWAWRAVNDVEPYSLCQSWTAAPTSRITY